jgi:phage FluMu protein Com
MPSIAEYLHDFARSMAGNAPQLETELRGIEARKYEIESKLEAARLARDRASRFIPSSGLDTYCPRCWLTHELYSPLTPIPSDNARIDKFRCGKCNQLYEVEL